MLEAIKLNVRAIGVATRLARLTQGSISYRVKVITKYYPFFIEHTEKQQNRFKQNLRYLKSQRKENAYQSKIKALYEEYSQKIKIKVRQSAQKISQKQKSYYQKEAQGLLHSGMAYLSLYYESLQNMIEGRREVLHDQKFKFQDGVTVEEKRIKFQKYLSRLLGRKKDQIQRLEQEQDEKSQNKKNKRQNLEL